jgi:hypothetical protein
MKAMNPVSKKFPLRARVATGGAVPVAVAVSAFGAVTANASASGTTDAASASASVPAARVTQGCPRSVCCPVAPLGLLEWDHSSARDYGWAAGLTRSSAICWAQRRRARRTSSPTAPGPQRHSL